MRLLILTFYYPPDLAAGSFRAKALVDALGRRLGSADRLDVITTRPQRYDSFRPEAPETERDGLAHIRRIALPSHRSGMFDQSRAYAQYARHVVNAVRGERYDVVAATSSRLMTAALGAVVARRTSARLYLDIRDIFSDTMNGLLPGATRMAMMPLVNAIEHFAFKTAARVNLVSRGFTEYFTHRFPQHEFRHFTNGIDDEFLGYDFRARHARGANAPKVLLYAGNVGAGQGLDCIVPGLAASLGSSWRLRVIGAGSALAALQSAIDRSAVSNVDMIAPKARAELMAEYRDADCLFLHLNDVDAFLKVLPSKVFEYAATGKPILAGAAGHSAEFIQSEIENAAVFAPCDVAGAVAGLQRLSLSDTPRQRFKERFRRDVIMDDMARDILATADVR